MREIATVDQGVGAVAVAVANSRAMANTASSDHAPAVIEFRGFARIVQTFPDAHLVLAGPDDGMGAKVDEWLRNAGVADKATRTGMIEGEVKGAALAATSVFALPSYSENFGIAVLEAMAAGVPVAISDQVNLWRGVERGAAGLVSPCNTDAFTGLLERLLGDPAGAQRMGEAGRALAREKFTWPRIAGALETLYEDVAARRSIK